MVNDMAERFEKLYVLPSDLYSEGSPIIISAGSLLKDTETGKVIAQIKYHSISSIPIMALKIKVAIPPTIRVIGKSESKFILKINDPIIPTIIVAIPIT